MKKLLFISVLCLASASTVFAQTPGTPDPQQQSMIRNAQSRYMNSTNSKDKPHLKPTNLKQVTEQNDQVMREQEKANPAPPNPQVKKGQKNNSKKNKKVTKGRTREERVTAAERRLALAKNAKEDAMRAFTALLDRQKKEMAELQEKHNAEAATGLTEKMRQRHERELQELNAEQARQLMDAQKAVDETSRKYEEAMALCDKEQ